MKKILMIIILISLSLFSEKIFANNSFSGKENAIVETKIDTVVIIQKSIDEEMLRNYAQILEKTNNQLSLWYNPYGIFVAMLGILFTLSAIIAAFVIFRQSKEHKDLIKKSIEEHKQTLDNLIKEKENQMKNIEISIDKTINDYKMKLVTADNKHKTQIESFIEELEEQKDFLSSQIHSFNHSGWEYKDIQINYPINQFSKFYARIVLNEPNQIFTIYIQLRTKSNNLVWIGFAGNTGEKLPFKGKNEYKVDIGTNPNTNRVVMNENIFTYFKEGFSHLNTIPVEVVCVRLRGSDVNTKDITFSFRIS